ncbi:MAG: dTDP-4-dehydrorhamnose 3,5-epimerase family protein, partial [Hyphomicrobiales bacterium]
MVSGPSELVGRHPLRRLSRRAAGDGRGGRPAGRTVSMLLVEPTALPDVKIIQPKRFGDHRGFFSETYSRSAFAEAGITLD